MMGNVAIPLMATDQDMDTLTLTAANLPVFCALTDNGGGMGSIDCMPGAGTANTYTAKV